MGAQRGIHESLGSSRAEAEEGSGGAANPDSSTALGSLGRQSQESDSWNYAIPAWLLM